MTHASHNATNSNTNANTKIRLMKRGDDGTRCVTAVIRPAQIAQQWAKEKNSKLDFYCPLCWVVEK